MSITLPRRLGLGLATLAVALSGASAADASTTRVDLITNNGFEETANPKACFAPYSSADGTVASTTTNPITGARSLAVTVKPWSRVGCIHDYPYNAGPKADAVSIEGDLRIDTPASGSGKLEACAIVYYADSSTPASTCKAYGIAAHAVTHVALSKATDGKQIARAFFQLDTTDTKITATLDNAHLYVDALPGDTGGGGGDGDSGDGDSGDGDSGDGGPKCKPATEPIPSGPPNAASPCDVNAHPGASTNYTPKTPVLASGHPYISLQDYTVQPSSSAIATKFKQYVDRAVVGRNPDWGYTSADAVVQYARGNDTKYIDDAIASVDATVKTAEAAIAQSKAPSIAGDDYLGVGPTMEALSFAYDYGYDRLTASQRTRWKAFGDQVIANLWSPKLASWGGKPAGTHAWSAWSINDPGNNYFFSFVQATQDWALATANTTWMTFLQKSKLPLLADYYAALPGGGSAEGTGYGTAQTRLWFNARLWHESTGDVLPTVANHARDSIEYWINATLPTLDLFAPIGDISRESIPSLYDYQENLVREAIMAAPGTPEARHGLWWINHNSVPDTLTSGFNLRGALLTPADTAQAPTALVYHATGVGQVFARSSWGTDATWLNVSAGRYDQSHAHHDQGAFTLYRGTWQSVTSNIWSASGLEGVGGSGGYDATAASNTLRFDRASGEPINQNYSTSPVTEETGADGTLNVHADLAKAYSVNAASVKAWTRDFAFKDNTLRVKDTCSVAAGITPVFQIHVPVKPTHNGNGTITAGPLTVSTDPATSVALVDMTTKLADYKKGWRIELTAPNKACAFDVTLKAGAGTTTTTASKK